MAITQAEAEAFLAAAKEIPEPMKWTTRHGRAADVAQVRLEEGGLTIGDLVLVQMPADARHWSFKLRTSGTEVLRWDYLPEGRLRRHRNPASSPAWLPRVDRSLVHEHPTIGGRQGPFSLSLEDVDTHDHEHAFQYFCERANINPLTNYRPPPEPQLALFP